MIWAGSGVYGQSVDIWSSGASFELLTSEPLVPESFSQVLEIMPSLIYRWVSLHFGFKPSHLSTKQQVLVWPADSALVVVRQALAWDPAHRLLASELISQLPGSAAPQGEQAASQGEQAVGSLAQATLCNTPIQR